MTTPTSLPDGTILCLACGFCCDGTLHTHTILHPDEVATVQELRLVVEISRAKPAFRQPCRMFQEGSCAIYLQRPQVCRRYECTLLKRCLAGEITLSHGLRVIDTVKAQLVIYRQYTPHSLSFMHWLKALDAAADTGGDLTDTESQMTGGSEALNHTVALATYLHRHFGVSAS